MSNDISQYLKLMADKGASDLFVTVGAPINIKINGETHPVGHDVLDSMSCRQLIYSLLADDQIKTFEATYELNIAISYAALGRFRINVYRQRGEAAMVVRYIKSEVPSVAKLGLPDTLEQLIMEKMGLILVVGATGSGKSTTLASMIDFRNSNHRGHILTIEDPVEFIHVHKKSLVDQREVGLDTKSYADALKNAMREAPDVIVIGEIRDHDTMQHAIHYAETGHVCLSTLHANNAHQTLERILNFFPEASRKSLLTDLSQHLKAIIAQRLLPAMDGGRIPAIEILLNSPYISELIESGRITEIHDAMLKSELSGMKTFDQSLFELATAGKVQIDDALMNADSRNNLSLRLRLESGSDAPSSDHLSLEP
jgi:twitching motility protein PilU